MRFKLSNREIIGMQANSREKAKMIQSATFYFSKYGKGASSLTQITQHVGMSGASIHRHFRDIDHLYEIVLRTVLKKMIHHLHYNLLMQHIKQEEKGRVVEIFFQYWRENPEALNLLVSEMNSGGDTLQKILGEPQSSRLSDKVHNIMTILEKHIMPGTKSKAERLQRFVGFVGVMMVYFLMESLFKTLFEIDRDKRSEFLQQRMEMIDGVYQEYINYIKQKS